MDSIAAVVDVPLAKLGIRDESCAQPRNLSHTALAESLRTHCIVEAHPDTALATARHHGAWHLTVQVPWRLLGYMALPRLFIGSSSEGLSVAQHLQVELEGDAECTVWTQGTFGPSKNTLDSLIDVARDINFAALVLTPDDLITKRDKHGRSPRDNVLFELGLFTGALGKRKVFFVYCRDEPIELPSDLAGTTAVTYRARSDGNLQAALGPACTKIRSAMAARNSNDELGNDQLIVRLLTLKYVNDREFGHLRTLDGRAKYPYERTAALLAWIIHG